MNTSTIDAPGPAIVLESDAWDFHTGNAKTVGAILASIAGVLGVVAVISYWGATSVVLTGLFAVGLCGLVVLGYASGVEIRLLVAILVIPVLFLAFLIYVAVQNV